MEETLSSDCTIVDTTDLTADMVKLSSDVFAWGNKLAQCKKAESEAKLQKDKVSAELDAMARETLAGDKKPTEAAIANWVKSHPVMQNAEQHVVDASFQTDSARAVVEALRTKQEMLVLLGSKS